MIHIWIVYFFTCDQNLNSSNFVSGFYLLFSIQCDKCSTYLYHLHMFAIPICLLNFELTHPMSRRIILMPMFDHTLPSFHMLGPITKLDIPRLERYVTMNTLVQHWLWSTKSTLMNVVLQRDDIYVRESKPHYGKTILSEISVGWYMVR